MKLTMLLRGVASVTLFFVCMLFFCFSVYAEDAREETEILASSSAPGSSIKFIQGLKDGFLVLNKDATFRIKAFVKPVTISDETIYAQKELSMPEPALVCRKRPCSRKYEWDFSGQPLSMSEFSRLQIAWSQLPFGATPEITVDAVITHGKNERRGVHIKGKFTETSSLKLQPSKTIAMKDVKYEEKSFWYLTKRELGLKDDERWRYDQDGERLILQARMDLPLKDAQAVQIYCNADQPIEAVQFSVDANGNGRRDIFILYRQVIQNIEKKPGLHILTIDLRGAIKSLGIDPEKAILQEPIIFLPAIFSSYAQKQPIHKIVFAGVDQTEDAEFIKPEVHQKAGQYSLAFDFSDVLDNLSLWDAKLKRLRVDTKLSGSQVVAWEKVRFLDMRKTHVPLIVREPGKAFDEWTEIPKKNAQNEGTKITGIKGQDEALQPFRAEIKAFRPVWAQMYREHANVMGKSAEATLLAGSDGGRGISDVPEICLHDVSGDSGASSREGVRIDGLQWCSRNTVFKGKPYFYSSGIMENSVIQWEIAVLKEGVLNRVPVPFPLNPEWLASDLGNGAHIEGVRVKGPLYAKTGPLRLDLAVLDVQVFQDGNFDDYGNAQWWSKEEAFPLVVAAMSQDFVEKQQSVLFFPKRTGENVLTFTLPDQEFILPLELSLPEKIPQPCVVKLKMNGHEATIPYGPYQLSLLPFGPGLDNFELTATYLGEEKIIAFPIPRVKVMGLKHIPEDTLKKIAVSVDGQKLENTVLKVPAVQGEWVDMGSCTLGEGEHEIQVTQSPYFTIKTLLLETDTPLPWTQEEKSQVEVVPFWKKMALLGAKFLVVVCALFVTYLFRSPLRNFLRNVFRPIGSFFSRTYWRLSDLKWIVIWTVTGFGLYIAGLMKKAGGENYGATFGGMALVLIIWHLGRILKSRVSDRFPKVAVNIYRNRGAPFFASAIGLLILTALLVAAGLEPIAEQVAIVVYYLLVVGVAGEVVDLKLEGGMR